MTKYTYTHEVETESTTYRERLPKAAFALIDELLMKYTKHIGPQEAVDTTGSDGKNGWKDRIPRKVIIDCWQYVYHPEPSEKGNRRRWSDLLIAEEANRIFRERGRDELAVVSQWHVANYRANDLKRPITVRTRWTREMQRCADAGLTYNQRDELPAPTYEPPAQASIDLAPAAPANENPPRIRDRVERLEVDVAAKTKEIESLKSRLGRLEAVIEYQISEDVSSAAERISSWRKEKAANGQAGSY